MSATDFIKQHGVDKAREIVEGAPELAEYYSTIDGEYYRIEINAVNLKQLKRLVESVDLVESFNGVEMAKRYLEENMECSDSERLKQAIADYESIESCKCVVTRTYENGTCNKCGMQDMGDDSHIENSPLCKVWVK